MGFDLRLECPPPEWVEEHARGNASDPDRDLPAWRHR